MKRPFGLRPSCRWLAAALLLAALGARSGAEGPADDERARQLSDEGLARFNQGRYPEAIAAFDASFAIRPLPVLLFNIAQAHRLAGDCRRALDFYRRYLRETPDAANRGLVEGFVAEMETCVRALPPPVVTAPPPEVAPPPVVVAPPPVVAAPIGAAPAKQPLYKKWWLWTTVAAVAVVAAGVGLGVGLSGGPPSPSLGAVSWRP